MLFDEVYKMMLNVDKQSLDMSLQDCHVKGCFSLVVGGTEHGKLTRVFIATKKIKPFDIQFHSHRYNLKIGVVHGVFDHHTALEEIGTKPYFDCEAVRMRCYEYKSPLNGGTGLTKTGESNWKLDSYKAPVGAEIFLPHDLIHSVSCSKGSIWIVQELGFMDDSSTVLGTDFATEGLYRKPEQFQVNNMYEQVLSKLKKLV